MTFSPLLQIHNIFSVARVLELFVIHVEKPLTCLFFCFLQTLSVPYMKSSRGKTNRSLHGVSYINSCIYSMPFVTIYVKLSFFSQFQKNTPTFQFVCLLFTCMKFKKEKKNFEESWNLGVSRKRKETFFFFWNVTKRKVWQTNW